MRSIDEDTINLADEHGGGVKYCVELEDGAQLILAKRGKGCSGQRFGQGVNQVKSSVLSVVGGGCLGHGAIAEKKTVLAMRLAAVDGMQMQ